MAPKKDPWQDFPSGPDLEQFATDLSCQGTLALALRETLIDIHKEQVEQQLNSDTEDRDDALIMDPIAMDCILKSLGEAMVKNKSVIECMAPPALLQGRMDHFNRQDHKWKIAVDSVEIRERKPLDRWRRKRERPSLWKEEEDESKKAARIEFPGAKLQLLGYNDV